MSKVIKLSIYAHCKKYNFCVKANSYQPHTIEELGVPKTSHEIGTNIKILKILITTSFSHRAFTTTHETVTETAHLKTFWDDRTSLPNAEMIMSFVITGEITFLPHLHAVP